MSNSPTQAHEKGHYREPNSPDNRKDEDPPAEELLEAVLQKVLQAHDLTPEDRGALEKAVFIARNLRKKTKEPRP